MCVRHGLAVCVGLFVWFVVATFVGPAVLAQDDEAPSARTWLGRFEPLEEFIRDAEVVRIEDIGIGVTAPKRADLEPGGPVERIAFKPIRPGNYNGHWESYESEIAAYELDKLFELGMVPPTVEKRIVGNLGAAVMWVSPTESFSELGGSPSPPSTEIGRWNYQLIRAKMFHNLIYNEGSQSRELAGRPLLEPDPDRQLACVHADHADDTRNDAHRPRVVESVPGT